MIVNPAHKPCPYTTHLQDQHALLNQRVVMQISPRRQHQQIRQQLINMNIIPAPCTSTPVVGAAAAVFVRAACTPQLLQNLLHVCFQSVDSSVAWVLYGLLLRSGLRLLLLDCGL
jgi:hypothetical protein